jgi:hypothetical protein
MSRSSAVLAATAALCILAAAGCVAPRATPAPARAPRPARDWTWVQGAVFVPTNCVNEAQQWDEYDPAVNDRELRWASAYGINLVRVYLHYYVYLKKRDALLADISDFLARADGYGIKAELVFFDDCWNQPPAELLGAGYRYPAPLPGVHNSRWLVCPGDDVQAHYAEHRERLRAYVQDVVRAHRDDPRVAFWEIYNEPGRGDATVRLERDAASWIRQTGTSIPMTATGGEFSGGPFSDFPSWHEYGGYKVLGGADTLCTECMNREGQGVPGIVEHFKGKVGYVMWEFGIGRDNCRFAWSENRDKPRPGEARVPFHGIVYPDGHPWSLDDARALLGGAAGFGRARFFAVQYYADDAFARPLKASVTPAIDFDLPDEDGAGSPDATAGVPWDRFSERFTGSIAVPADGVYTFTVDSDGIAELRVDGRTVVSKAIQGRETAVGTARLQAGRTLGVEVRYSHSAGAASLHVAWSGPGFGRRVLEPATHPEGS